MEKENNMPRGCTSTEAAWWHEPPAACEQGFLAYDGQSCMSAGQDVPVEQGLVLLLCAMVMKAQGRSQHRALSSGHYIYAQGGHVKAAWCGLLAQAT